MSDEQIRLSPHVVQQRGDDGGKYPHGNPLRVTAGGTTVLLDSTFGTDTAAADLLLLSHYHEDHAVTAADAPRVAVHRRDAPAVRSTDGFCEHIGMSRDDTMDRMLREFSWAPIPAVEEFTGGDVFEVGAGVTITVLELPGHTAGHCGFLIEPDGVFYLADVDLTSFGPRYGDRYSSLADTRRTLRVCRRTEAAVYAPFHHKGPHTDRDAFLAALDTHAAKLDEREDTVLDLLRNGVTGPERMAGHGVLFRPGPRPFYGDAVERITARRHLEELVERGTVSGPDDAGAYRLA